MSVEGTRSIVGLCTLTALLGCRAAPPRVVASSRVTLARIAVLAREGSAEFPVDGALDDQGGVAIDGGTFAILDFDQARIVEMDTTGRVLRSFGRHGGGPGEIEEPRFLVRTPAGLGVVDDRKYALVQFTLDGRAAPDRPLTTLVGVPSGILVGLAGLSDGSWIFAVREKRERTWREALYHHRAEGSTREVASTPMAETRPVRLPCGITLSAEPPVFWPNIRWSARPTEVAFAATERDRVTRWDPSRSDSTSIEFPGPLPSFTTAEALASLPRTSVVLGNNGCVLTPEEALRQRGMARHRPAIDRVMLSPSGELWVRSRRGDGGAVTRSISVGGVDTVGAGPFPELFLTPDRFLATVHDSAGGAALELWEVRRAARAREPSH